MKRMILAGISLLALAAAGQPAAAADMAVATPVRARPPVVVAALYNWTGCYVGGHVGGGWGKKSWTDPSPDPGQISTDEGTDDVSGFLGGGQLGCNFQTGPWLFGAEGDFSWANLSGDHPNPIFVPDVMHSKVDWLSTVTGRVGYAFDRALIYVKGGGAWAHDKFSVSDPTSGTFATATETRWGWTVGAGLEYGLAPNWSVKLEYNYLDFGTDRVRLNCPICTSGGFDKDIRQQIHAVKLGVNYRFNWWTGPVGPGY
jgi:outer membrane immunogenic protein